MMRTMWPAHREKLAMSDTPNEKACSECGVVKPLADFYVQAAGKYGHTSKCIRCMRARSTERRDRLNPVEQRPHVIRKRLLEQGLKKCTHCEEIKAVTEFHKVRRPNGYVPDSWCKRCEAKRFKVWQTENRDYRREYNRNRGEDPDVSARKKELRRERIAKSPRLSLQMILCHAVRRVPTENPATIGDLMAMWEANDGRCALSGIPMVWGQGRVSPYSASVDRIDPTKGYSADNVRIVCHSVNAFRGRMTDTEMLGIAKEIVAFLGPKLEAGAEGDLEPPPLGLLACV